MDAFTSNPRQKATEVPLYEHYRADLEFSVNEKEFDGVGTITLDVPTKIKIESQINLDRVTVETCGRSHVCSNTKPCIDAFDISGGFFGGTGKKMTYTYIPAEHEKECSIYVEAWDKDVLAAWGYLGFIPKENKLPAQVICNGETKNYTGHAVCQSKIGILQRVRFAVPVRDFEAEEQCGLEKLEDNLFQFRPTLGKCNATFYAGGHFFSMTLFAYKEVFIRGK